MHFKNVHLFIFGITQSKLTDLMIFGTLNWNNFLDFLKVKWLHVTGELDKSVRCSCQICQMAIEQFSLYQLAPEINNSKDSLGENCY